MTHPKAFPFDAEQIANFFEGNNFLKGFSIPKMPAFEKDALLAAQKKNMDTLIEANKVAAVGYQELYSAQVKAFEDSLAATQEQIANLDRPTVNADVANTHGDVAKAAFEKALKNMTELAEGAQKANADSFEVISRRVQESVSELQELTKKYST